MQESDFVQQSSNITLGRYHLLRCIGRGGMGEAWLAEDPLLHRQVAIKTLPAHNQDDHDYSRRFEREAQAAAALTHPHILPVHSYGEQPRSDGQVVTYIVMPYIAGGSLAERITTYTSRQMMMPPQEAITYLSQAAEAIDYAHSRGVIHRDIKPGNMLLQSDDWLLLADFGIARMLAQEEQLTKTGIGFGTLEYMAPEQAQGKAEPASDNYSLAVITYQLFTGQVPFSADSAYAITMQHILTPPPSPRQINPALPLAVEQVLLRGLAKVPQQRPPSARAFVAELGRAWASAPFAGTLMQAPLPPTGGTPLFSPAGRDSLPNDSLLQADGGKVTAAPAQKGMTRRQVLIGGGAALAMAGGGLGIWELSSRSRPSPQRSGGTTPGTQQTTSTTGTNGPAMTLLGHSTAVQVLAWSPSANILASSGSTGDNQVFLWDIDSAYQQKNTTPTHTSTAVFDLTPNGILVAWSPDGAALAIANTVARKIANNPYVLLVYKGDLSGPAPGYEKALILFSDVIAACSWLDTTYIVTVTTQALPATMMLQLWDWRHPGQRLAQASIARTLSPAPSPLTIPSQALSVSPRGSLVALIAQDDAGQDSLLIGQLVVSGKRARWQQRLPAILFRRNNSPIPFSINGIAWFPSGQTIAAFTNDADARHTLATWHIQHTQSDPITFAGPSAHMLTTIAVSPVPSPSLLAVGTDTGTIFLLNLDHHGSIERTFQGPHAEITALAWSRDGKWLAVGFNDTNASILVWKM
jgi:eukaryotic-like serine/threonine-protein kinase